jgi:hypothetical protein
MVGNTGIDLWPLPCERKKIGSQMCSLLQRFPHLSEQLRGVRSVVFVLLYSLLPVLPDRFWHKSSYSYVYSQARRRFLTRGTESIADYFITTALTKT